MKECSVLVGQGKNSFSNTADKKMNLSIRHKTNLTISTEGEKGRKKEGSSPSQFTRVFGNAPGGIVGAINKDFWAHQMLNLLTKMAGGKAILFLYSFSF